LLTGFVCSEACRHRCGANISGGEFEVKTAPGLKWWMQTRGLWRGRKRGPCSWAWRMLRPLESSSRVSRDNLGEGSCDEVTSLLAWRWQDVLLVVPVGMGQVQIKGSKKANEHVEVVCRALTLGLQPAV